MKQNNNAKTRPLHRKKNDLLDKLIERKDPDDLGLLDLLLVEEMMSQDKESK